MATTRIELPEQLEAYVQFKIASGLYSNGAEVIRDALRHMMQDDEEALRALRLRDALALGFAQIERGEGSAYTSGMMDQLKQRAAERAVAGHNPNADVQCKI